MYFLTIFTCIFPQSSQSFPYITIRSCLFMDDLNIYFYFQETHVIHMFKEDFYGSTLKVIMLGYIRPMKNFSSLGKCFFVCQLSYIIHLHLKKIFMVLFFTTLVVICTGCTSSCKSNYCDHDFLVQQNVNITEPIRFKINYS